MAKKESKLSPELAKVELLIRAKEINKKLLLSKPNVIGLNVAHRIKEGKVTEEMVVTVYVSRKLDQSKLSKEQMIPKTLKINDREVPVDVVEGTIPRPQVFTLRSRPFRGGSSIGPANARLAGTGGICVTLNDGNTFILSCNHVIAGANLAGIGTAVVQPSLIDGGTAVNDTIGILYSFVPLDFGTINFQILGKSFTIPNPNYVDAAIARITVPTAGYNVGNREIHWIGYPKMHIPSTWDWFEQIGLLGRRVCKMGERTEFTIGKITSVSYDTWVGPYDNNNQNAWFENQIEIEGENGPFSDHGDSGSLIVDFETLKPIGLLFCGDGNFTYANPIHEVLVRLAIPQI